MTTPYQISALVAAALARGVEPGADAFGFWRTADEAKLALVIVVVAAPENSKPDRRPFPCAVNGCGTSDRVAGRTPPLAGVAARTAAPAVE